MQCVPLNVYKIRNLFTFRLQVVAIMYFLKVHNATKNMVCKYASYLDFFSNMCKWDFSAMFHTSRLTCEANDAVNMQVT